MTAPEREREREEIPLGKRPCPISTKLCDCAHPRLLERNNRYVLHGNAMPEGKEGVRVHGHTNELTKSTHSPDTASAPNVPFVCFIHDHREGEERRRREERRNDCTLDGK